MAWTTPKTDWAESDLVDESHMNDIGNNLAALKDPPSENYELDEMSDVTTTSTSFVDVDATNLALTIVTNGSDVLVHFHGMVNTGGSGNALHLNVDVDGSPVAGEDGIAGLNDTNVSVGVFTVTFTRLITGLSAGSHTFKLQWKVTSGTGTLSAGAGTTDEDTHPQFWAREVS